MSKYDRLGSFLKTQNREHVPMSFADVERVTQTKLPPSAHRHRPWWSNNPNNSVLTRVWLEAGFKSEQVDMEGRKLVFRRVTVPSPAKSGGDGTSSHPLFGALKGAIKIAPDVDLTKPADPAWGE